MLLYSTFIYGARMQMFSVNGFLEKRCHCEESSTKQSRDSGEIASQSLAMTMPFHEN